MLHPDAGPAGGGPPAAFDGSSPPPVDSAAAGSKDAVQNDVTIRDGASDDGGVGSGDTTTVAPGEAGPAYQEGWPFGRIQYDFLGKGYGEWVCGVLPQANGQVVLVGTANTDWVSSFTDPANNVFTLVRLNADGKVDTTYGSAGKTSVAVPGHELNFCRAALQAKDGKILAAGDAIFSVSHAGGTFYNDDFVVARFNQDGTLDTGFGDGGMAITNFHLTADDAGQDDKVTSMALLDDGRILVAGSRGSVQSPSYSYPAFARYTPDGAPDSTFGAAGMVALDPTALKGTLVNSIVRGGATAVIADADGGAVAGISVSGNSAGYAIAILRLGPDGNLDPSFGDGGVHWEAPESKWADLEILQLSRNVDGKLVVLAGYYGASTVLYRYSAQGLVDPSFGSGGQVSRPNETPGAWQTLFMLRPADGSFLVGLGAPPVTGGYGSDSMGTFSLIHFSADGVFDDAFGELGWNWGTGAGVPVAYISAGALLDSGDIIVAGDITTNRQNDTNTIALYLKKNAGN